MWSANSASRKFSSSFSGRIAPTGSLLPGPAIATPCSRMRKRKETPLVFLLALDNRRRRRALFRPVQRSPRTETQNSHRTFPPPQLFPVSNCRWRRLSPLRRMQCLVVEGACRETYDEISRAVGWPAAPAPVDAPPTRAFWRPPPPLSDSKAALISSGRDFSRAVTRAPQVRLQPLRDSVSGHNAGAFAALISPQ